MKGGWLVPGFLGFVTATCALVFVSFVSERFADEPEMLIQNYGGKSVPVSAGLKDAETKIDEIGDGEELLFRPFVDGLDFDGGADRLAGVSYRNVIKRNAVLHGTWSVDPTVGQRSRGAAEDTGCR